MCTIIAELYSHEFQSSWADQWADQDFMTDTYICHTFAAAPHGRRSPTNPRETLKHGPHAYGAAPHGARERAERDDGRIARRASGHCVWSWANWRRHGRSARAAGLPRPLPRAPRGSRDNKSTCDGLAQQWRLQKQQNDKHTESIFGARRTSDEYTVGGEADTRRARRQRLLLD